MADKKKHKIRSWLLDFLCDSAGCFLFAVSIQCFSAPNNIAPGGVTGVAILLEYLFGLPIAAVSLLINLPLLVLAWMFLGRRFTVKTIQTVLIMTLALAICAHFPQYRGEPMLAALYGGVLTGAGLALVFMRASSTGGIDIVTLIIRRRFPHMQVGRLMLMVDALIVSASALVFRSVDVALYAIISIFTFSRMLDGILDGLETGRLTMVISTRYEEIAYRITSEMDRGCTLLDSEGGYTSSRTPMLLCAVRKTQYYQLKRLIHEIDPDAFLVSLETTEISGEGFRRQS